MLYYIFTLSILSINGPSSFEPVSLITFIFLFYVSVKKRIGELHSYFREEKCKIIITLYYIDNVSVHYISNCDKFKIDSQLQF